MGSFKIKHVFKNLKLIVIVNLFKNNNWYEKTKQNTININCNLSPSFWYLFNYLVGIKEKW